MKISEKQSQLWKLAERVAGDLAAARGWPREYSAGVATIQRNPDRAVRQRANEEGTFEWALFECQGLSNPQNDGIFTDEYCDRLIGILEAS